MIQSYWVWYWIRLDWIKEDCWASAEVGPLLIVILVLNLSQLFLYLILLLFDFLLLYSLPEYPALALYVTVLSKIQFLRVLQK